MKDVGKPNYEFIEDDDKMDTGLADDYAGTIKRLEEKERSAPKKKKRQSKKAKKDRLRREAAEAAVAQVIDEYIDVDIKVGEKKDTVLTEDVAPTVQLNAPKKKKRHSKKAKKDRMRRETADAQVIIKENKKLQSKKEKQDRLKVELRDIVDDFQVDDDEEKTALTEDTTTSTVQLNALKKKKRQSKKEKTDRSKREAADAEVIEENKKIKSKRAKKDCLNIVVVKDEGIYNEGTDAIDVLTFKVDDKDELNFTELSREIWDAVGM